MKPEWWPENPYPIELFPMTIKEYVESIPDKNLRTALSGCLMREGWKVAEGMIFDRLQNIYGDTIYEKVVE